MSQILQIESLHLSEEDNRLKIDLLIYFSLGLLKMDLLDETIHSYLTEVNHPPITTVKTFLFSILPSLIFQTFLVTEIANIQKSPAFPRTEGERKSSFKGIW